MKTFIEEDIDYEVVDEDNSVDVTEIDDSEPIEEGLDDTELILTTADNPYNPKVDYGKWRQWDIDNGYHTEEFVARLVDLNDDDVDIDDEVMITQLTTNAINSIIEEDRLGIYLLI